MSSASTPPATIDGVPSPCINVCRINADSGYCDGCYRTVMEIACWSRYTDEQKRGVLAHLPERKQGC